MRIRFFCHYGQLTGYGRAARDYLAALALHLRHLDIVNEPAAGVATEHPWAGERYILEIVAYEDLHPAAGTGARNWSCSPEPRYQHLDELVVQGGAALMVPADVEIHHANPRLLAQIAKGETGATLELGTLPSPRRRIALTTWETSEFPEEYAGIGRSGHDGDHGTVAGFDAVIVPSTFCRDVIFGTTGQVSKERGAYHRVDVKVLPHCYDPEFWATRPAWRARDVAPTADTGLPVRFYTIGAAGERKNIAGIIKAYLHAFTAADHVSLMIVGGDQNEMRGLCARSGIPAAEQPTIMTTPGAVDEEVLREIHGDADCYVSATRGEGWGLGLFEAAIMGRWIVTPLYGGQEDFLSPADATGEFNPLIEYPWHLHVEHFMTPCFGSEVRGEIFKDPQGRLHQSAKVSIPPGVTAKQRWAEPNLHDLAAQMHAVYLDRLARLNGGATPGFAARDAEDLDAVAASFARRYGYAPIGEAFYKLIQEISA